MLEAQLANSLKDEVLHRLYDECLVRIRICLDKLTDAQVWWRPNESSNSIGNLILHLNGNVRQWILTGLGGIHDDRRRQEEFDQRMEISKEDLWNRLNSTMQELIPVIKGVTPEELLRMRPVQTFEESGMTIIVHVTEHFSYHTGQIAWITKMLTSKDLGFYEGVPLE
jgi:uncharacterized damage-inducible protein DinB